MKLFDDYLPFYKGNLHMHTTNSDGKLNPEEAMALYWAAEYDFITLTDHWQSMPQRWYENMLVLSGVEIDYLDSTQALHIVGVGVDPEKLNLNREEMKQRPYQDGIDMLRAAGGRAILAHPAWSLNTLERIASLRGLSAAEVYNSLSGPPYNADRADSSSLLDMYAANGLRLPFVAVDDSHFYGSEHCRSYLRIQAQELTRESLLSSLDAGTFYASQGPEIHQIDLTPERLIIHCSPVSRAIIYSNLPWVSGRTRLGEAMTEVIYQRNPKQKETFLRCEIMDDQGNKAWTSPMIWPEGE